MATKKQPKRRAVKKAPAKRKAPVRKKPRAVKAKPGTASRAKPRAAPGNPIIPETLPNNAQALTRIVERVWPTSKSGDVARLFEALRAALEPKAVPAAPAKPRRPRGTQRIDLLDMLRRTFTSHDLLFLRKRITYHIAASSTLPAVFVDPDRVQAALTSLVEYVTMHTPRGGRIGIHVGEIKLRSGPGVQVSFASKDDALYDTDKMAFMNRMYEAHAPEGAALVSCREIISSQGGQMWADLPEPGRPTYFMVLPSSEVAAQMQERPQTMFKYDIAISNYANIRKRFGIKKSLMLVGQIEMYVRALVRHPIDIVSSARERGVITTIYESPSGAAQSVASRISQRLGTEEFHIGKRVVDCTFRYQLSKLPTNSAREQHP